MSLAPVWPAGQSHAMSENFPNLPKAIAAYTDRPGQTQASLSRALDVSRGTVTRWMKGEEPEVKRLQDIAKELGVTVGYLAGDSDWIQSPDERKWVERYRRLSPEGRVAFERMADAMESATRGLPE